MVTSTHKEAFINHGIAHIPSLRETDLPAADVVVLQQLYVHSH